MRNNHSKIIFMIVLLVLLFTGCTDSSLLKNETNPVESQEEGANTILENSKRFLDVGALGKQVIDSDGFISFLSKIPPQYANERIFVARVDEFGIGSAYKKMNQWDLALENGLIKGLISSEYEIAEKLDFISPRDAAEFVGTSPQQGFYMHGINLTEHSIITNDYNSSLLLEYQVMEFSEMDLSTIIYFRLVDLKSMRILGSTLIKAGVSYDQLNQENISKYDRTYSAVSNFDFHESVYPKLTKAAVLDIDILNIGRGYENAPSKSIMAIENGLISGLIGNDDYTGSAPSMIEKSTGFKLKYPEVYNSIVFNTNPLLYEEWSEFISATGCSELIMYRYIPDEGLYIRILDATQNGNIFFSDVIPFEDSKDAGVFSNHNLVAENFNDSFNYELLKGKKLMLVDGDKQAIEAQKYSESRRKYDEMQLALEEGMISALVKRGSENDFSVYEKLKTLYLKRPWMYENKVFNLNPLYLDDWKQLRDFGVNVLVLYNNLIPYEEITSSNEAYSKIAITYRVIDLTTGDVIHVGELSSLRGDDK